MEVVSTLTSPSIVSFKTLSSDWTVEANSWRSGPQVLRIFENRSFFEMIIYSVYNYIMEYDGNYVNEIAFGLFGYGYTNCQNLIMCTIVGVKM